MKARCVGSSAGTVCAPLTARVLSGHRFTGLQRKQQKRAKAAGAPAADIEEAEDADDPKAALIDILVSRQTSEMAGLASMKPSALKKRARAAGATEAEIEAAEDADDVKAATISLILSHEQSAGTEPSTRPQPA